MIRAKKSASIMYTSYKPKRRPELRFEKPRFAADAQVEDTSCCTDCGWPIKAVPGAAIRAQVDGVAAFKHFRCPSLAKRRQLRAEEYA